jgi:Dihydrodipicolinate synthetase family
MFWDALVALRGPIETNARITFPHGAGDGDDWRSLVNDGTPKYVLVPTPMNRQRLRSIRTLRMRVEIDGEFTMLAGEDATAVAYLVQGGDGCISLTANVVPRLLVEMHEVWRHGEIATVRQINERLIPLHDALLAETSPAPVKFASSLIGKMRGDGPTAAVPDHARDAGRGGAGDAPPDPGDDGGERPLRRAKPARPS